MSLFYVRDGEPYIPDEIGRELAKLAYAIVKTCRLSFKVQMKTAAINNAIKSGDKEQMHSMLQKVLEKYKKAYTEYMSLSGAEINEVNDAFFADKDNGFYVGQLKILLDLANINCIAESRMMPLLSGACEKTLGKHLDELYFFSNQGEIRKNEAEENEANEENKADSSAEAEE